MATARACKAISGQQLIRRVGRGGAEFKMLAGARGRGGGEAGQRVEEDKVVVLVVYRIFSQVLRHKPQ